MAGLPISECVVGAVREPPAGIWVSGFEPSARKWVSGLPVAVREPPALLGASAYCDVAATWAAAVLLLASVRSGLLPY